MLDAVVISDLHLGSVNCQADRIKDLLWRIESGQLATDRLILNGDVFDSMDFTRLDKSHWKILSMIRRLSGVLKVVWLAGNHDGPAEAISHLLGVEVRDEYVFSSGGRQILCLHGDVHDEFIQSRPLLTWLADWVYQLLLWIDRTHELARWAKSGSKTFLRNVQKVKTGAVTRALELGCESVLCGHTHVGEQAGLAWLRGHGVAQVRYFNSGCWTELPGSYLMVHDGNVFLCEATLPKREPPAA